MFENFAPKEGAVLVERLKNTGTIVIGKTNIPELALVPDNGQPSLRNH
ncbi:MAG: amidase family protein [Candidatus Freyarchaeota archaeon]